MSALLAVRSPNKRYRPKVISLLAIDHLPICSHDAIDYEYRCLFPSPVSWWSLNEEISAEWNLSSVELNRNNSCLFSQQAESVCPSESLLGQHLFQSCFLASCAQISLPCLPSSLARYSHFSDWILRRRRATWNQGVQCWRHWATCAEKEGRSRGEGLESFMLKLLPCLVVNFQNSFVYCLLCSLRLWRWDAAE